MNTGLSALSNGLMGVRRGLHAMEREARTVARAIVDGSGADLAGAMVRTLEAQRVTEASATVIRRSNQAIGSIIDLRV